MIVGILLYEFVLFWGGIVWFRNARSSQHPPPRVICCVVQRSMPKRCHYWRMLWVIYWSKVDFIRVVGECHVVVIHMVYVEHICTQPQSLEVTVLSLGCYTSAELIW